MTKSPHSLQGRLLLDGGKLRGSCFHRAVVLVCQHTPEGAFGLILNHPSDNKVGEVIEGDLPDTLHEQILFGGGPVQPAALSYLHASPGLPLPNVMPDLQVGHDLAELIDLGRSVSGKGQLRVFAGYAGWGPGQLDEEMRQESWLTEPATLEWVFHPASTDLWSRILLGRGDWKSRLLSKSPDDLTWN